MLTQDQQTRLQDIAFAACHAGAVYEAGKIFDGLLTLRPDNPVTLTGKAFSHMIVDDFTTAEGILRDQVLAKHPDDADAVSMLGLCFTLSGRHAEARELLGKTAEQQTPAGQLARDLLATLG